jgi:hypothetical protein
MDFQPGWRSFGVAVDKRSQAIDVFSDAYPEVTTVVPDGKCSRDLDSIPDFVQRVWDLHIQAQRVSHLEREVRELSNLKSEIQRLRLLESDLENQAKNLRADVLDQSDGRERWMKRAQRAEAKLAVHPYILALINGNHLWFRHRFSRSDRSAEVIDSLVHEMREHAQAKHTLPKSIPALIQIFVDLQQLSEDLRATESVSSSTVMVEFVQALNSQRHVSVIACDSKAVQHKLQTAYELNVENCHCQHVTLALGPSSYYSTLHEYADDELTLLKTSLVEPWDGFPGEYRLAFHKTHFSPMQHIPHISISPEPTPLARAIISETLPLDDAPPGSPKPGSSHLGSVRSTFSSQDISAISSHSSLLSQAHALPKNAPVSTMKPTQPAGSPSVVHSISHDSHSNRPESRRSSPPLPPSELSQAVNAPHPPLPSQPYSIEIVQALHSPSYQQAWEVASTRFEDLLCPSEDEDTRSLITKVSFPDHALPENGPDTVKQTPPPPLSHTAREKANVSIRAPKPLSPMNASDGAVEPIGPSRSSGVSSTKLTGPDLATVTPQHNDILRNQQGQRIDLSLPEVDASSYAAFQKQIVRPCVKKHLWGKCNDAACQRSHQKLKPDGLLALKHYLRQQACRNGTRCRFHDCYYGHHCALRKRKSGICTSGMAHIDLVVDPTKTIRATPTASKDERAVIDSAHGHRPPPVGPKTSREKLTNDNLAKLDKSARSAKTSRVSRPVTSIPSVTDLTHVLG